MPLGVYTFTLERAEGDANGDWFELSVQYPGHTQPVELGALRYARVNASTQMIIPDGGITWTEFFNSNNTNPLDLPVFDIRYKFLQATNASGTVYKPARAYNTYSEVKNTDIKLLNATTLEMQQTGGGTTQRCHQTGTINAVQ